MKNDDDDLDPILEEHRIHIPADFADMVTAMDATSLRRKREADMNQDGVPYFDAVMASFFSQPAAAQ